MRVETEVSGLQSTPAPRVDASPHLARLQRATHPVTPVWSAVVALYCEDDAATPKVHRVLRRHVDFVQARSLQALAGLVSEASCTVVVVRRGSAVEELACSVALRRYQPLRPLVAVIPADGQEPRRLARSTGDEIVLLRDMEQALGPAVVRACLHGLLEELAAALEGEGTVPPKLRVALALACRARPPIRSVKELAAQIGCEPRTLEHHWRRAVPRAEGLRLHDLLAWLLVLHASTARLTVPNWAAVGVALGMCSQTLARLSRTLAGLSLREIAALGPRGVLPVFARRVLPALPGGAGNHRELRRLSAAR